MVKVPGKQGLLIPEASRWHRLWSVRTAFFWCALNGAVIGLAAFVDVINPWWFLGLNIAGYATVGVARLLKQPGLE